MVPILACIVPCLHVRSDISLLEYLVKAMLVELHASDCCQETSRRLGDPLLFHSTSNQHLHGVVGTSGYMVW